MAKKSHLFRPPAYKVFGSDTYWVSDGHKPISDKKEALEKAKRIRKDGKSCRVVKMNTEYYLYSRTKTKRKKV